MMRGRNRNQGFTIAELLIALVLLGVVSAQLMLAFSSQQQTYQSTDSMLEVQEDARLIIDLLSFDTRQAGFMVPSTVGVASEDGGTGGPDRFCVSDTGYFTLPNAGQQSDVFDDRVAEFTGSTYTGSSPMLMNTVDIDANGTVDFVVGGGVIVSNGAESACRRITNVAGNQVTIDSGFTLTGGGGIAVPAIIYEIQGTNLTRNNTVLASQIEDLQAEFWVDTSLDNLLDAGEFPIHDLENPSTALITSRVRRVRLTVVAVSATAEQSESQAYNLYLRPAAGNRDAGTVRDANKRRRFQASILPRNLAKQDPV